MKQLKVMAALIILMVFLTQPAGAAEIEEYTWTVPEGGTPVHHYELGLSQNGGDYVTLTVEPTINSVMLNFERNITYRVRVRAVDADGNASLWTEGSTPYAWVSPTICGIPRRVTK